SLCGLCRQRFDKNPLRILDCKTPACKEQLTDAPSVLDALDEECRAHFQSLQDLLALFKIPFTVNPKIVRGLDYYTRTVFEFIKENEPTVIGGGRYDGLISQVGGADTPGVGFGMGIERLVLLLQKQEAVPEAGPGPTIFIGHADAPGFAKAQELAYALRKAGIRAESDLLSRSVKAQMKYADKINARYTMILGETELAQNEVTVKNMQTGEQVKRPLDSLGAFL
ncbi:MAG: histidine--tRNA ligase, partial [Defluviitaleaceae bacterium]|nr:histidine--tRNA ligase [Defluviitaleaceae bacterium]